MAVISVPLRSRWAGSPSPTAGVVQTNSAPSEEIGAVSFELTLDFRRILCFTARSIRFAVDQDAYESSDSSDELDESEE